MKSFGGAAGNPLFNRWIRSQDFIQHTLNGRQATPRLLPGITPEALFLGLETFHLHPPEVLAYRSVKVLRHQMPLLPSNFCKTTFWISLPEGLATQLVRTGRLSHADLQFCVHYLQLCLCPRSAILLCTYSYSMLHHGSGAFVDSGHERITLLAVNFEHSLLSDMVENNFLHIWNRQFVDHHFALGSTDLTPVTLPMASMEVCGVAQLSCSHNFLAHHLNAYLNMNFLLKLCHFLHV